MQSFYYNGRKVIGIKSLTKKQYWITYGFIWAWFLTTLYIIIRSIFVDVYLLQSEVAPVLAITVFVFLWTFFTKKKMNRKNYIYETNDYIETDI